MTPDTLATGNDPYSALEALVEESNPSLVIDVGSGSAEYLVLSAQKNPSKKYVALDRCYGTKYLFDWGKIPGEDKGLLTGFLSSYLELSWAETADVSKSNDGRTIYVSDGKNSAEITMDEEKEEVLITTRYNEDYDLYYGLKTKEEDGKTKIYKSGSIGLEKTDNLEYILADARFLPIKDSCSDLTTEFYCSPAVLTNYPDGGEIVGEIYRITKSSGAGIIGPLPDVLGVLPSGFSARKKLVSLATKAKAIMSENADYWLPELLTTPAFLDIYCQITETMDVSTEDLLCSLGLRPNHKISADALYFYIWAKEEKSGENIHLLRTDPDVLFDLLGRLEKLDVSKYAFLMQTISVYQDKLKKFLNRL